MLFASELLLSLFILNLGVAIGAGLYEVRVVLPRWFPKVGNSNYRVDLGAMTDLDSGRKFWAMVTTAPLTLLTLVNVYLAWQSVPPVHDWWLAAALIALVERISTFTIFIPTIIRLQKANGLPPAAVRQTVSRWISLNYIRNLLTLIACLCALRALVLLA